MKLELNADSAQLSETQMRWEIPETRTQGGLGEAQDPFSVRGACMPRDTMSPPLSHFTVHPATWSPCEISGVVVV